MGFYVSMRQILDFCIALTGANQLRAGQASTVALMF